MATKTYYARPQWKAKDLIRHRDTGNPYLVLHVFIDICTLVIDLGHTALPTPLVVLPRDYQNYSRDLDMACSQETDQLNWHYQPLL